MLFADRRSLSGTVTLLATIYGSGVLDMYGRPLTSNPIYLTTSFYFLLRLRSRAFADTPIQAILLLMTYPLSVESVKVWL